MKTTRQKRAAPFYAAAAVWLAYALVLPLYEPLHYALAAGASLLAFAAAAALCRGGPVGEEAGKAPPEKAEEPVEKKPASTGNPELDKMAPFLAECSDVLCENAFFLHRQPSCFFWSRMSLPLNCTTAYIPARRECTRLLYVRSISCRPRLVLMMVGFPVFSRWLTRS